MREGDPRLELAAQVKESHAAFRALVMVRVGARFGSIIKWGQGPLPIVRNLERLAGADIFEGMDTGGDGAYLGGHFGVDGTGKSGRELGARHLSQASFTRGPDGAV